MVMDPTYLTPNCNWTLYDSFLTGLSLITKEIV